MNDTPFDRVGRLGRLGLVASALAAVLWSPHFASAAETYVSFDGEKSVWHDGFDRFDYVMDDETLLHVCGSLDPALEPQTRALERRYKELGGSMTVIVQEGVGHYPLAPRDPKPVMEFILGKAR